MKLLESALRGDVFLVDYECGKNGIQQGPEWMHHDKRCYRQTRINIEKGSGKSVQSRPNY
jgi:hypothetical protein